MRRMIFLTVLASVGASVVIVAGVRVVQRFGGSSFETVSVVADLPGAQDQPTRVVFGLHATQLEGGRGQVRARTRATGLLIATGSGGIPVGEAVVPRDRLLRATVARVDFQTTAASLVLESPALITSSPMLAALITAEARHSAQVTALADVLRSEAAVRRDYLQFPDQRLMTALAPAVGDVSRRVGADIAPGPAGVVASANGSAGRVLLASAAPLDRQVLLASANLAGRTVLASNRLAATSPPSSSASAHATLADIAPPPLPSDIVLRDSNNTTACSTHSVSDALCVTHTYPLAGASDPILSATDWSAGWQMLFLANRLRAGASGFARPFALLPPIVNAPPSISGTITTALSAGFDAAKTCYAVKTQLVGPEDCSKQDTLHAIGHDLLQELTLAGDSAAIRIPLDAQLEHQPISAIGFGVMPPPGVSETEAVAWGGSLVLTLTTELILPAIQLLLDVPSKWKEHADHSAETEGKGGEPSQAVGGKEKPGLRERIREQAAKIDKETNEVKQLQRQVDELQQRVTPTRQTQLVKEKGAARQAVTAAQTALAAANAHLQTAQDRFLTAQAQLTRDEAAGRATDTERRSVAAYRGHVTRAARQLKAAQDTLTKANAMLTDAEHALTAYGSDAEELTKNEAELKKAQDELEKDQKELTSDQLASGLEPIFTDTNSLIAVAAAAFLQIASDDRTSIVCAYQAIRANRVDLAADCLRPVMADLRSYEPLLLSLAENQITHFVLGAAVGTLVYAIPGLDVIDFASGIFGFAQDAVDVAATATIPDRHDFPAIDTNFRHGDLDGHLAKLVLAAVPRYLLNNPALLGTAVELQLRTGQQTVFADQLTTVCPDTVIVPNDDASGRLLGILNYSNWRDLHFAAGFGAVKRTVSLAGAVDFAAVKSYTPLGSGGASFGDVPNKGDPVHVEDEGSGLHYSSYDGVVTDRIPDTADAYVYLVKPGSSRHLSSARGAGGFVFARRGHNRGELVGLVEAEHDGKLVVLSGPGVENVTKGVCPSEG